MNSEQNTNTAVTGGSALTVQLDTDETPICSTHGTVMVEYDMDYESGRCLGRWFKCTHSQGTSDHCTNTTLIESEELKVFHKTGVWPKIGA
ncbi:MAG: hypothetical protein QX197_15930 [Methylococcaceae bacterium]